ncbi:hypothetical protein [Aeromicrobium sp. UC242_57]|uniref:hypothetical protein n=1 Tax=Aeromicrobium sp. UC242_57 TaxID=3374624 RepID=UPI0037B5132B
MPSEVTPSEVTKYRLDRQFVLPAIGLHLVVAGAAAALAFIVWEPLGVLAVLLLLNAVRVLAVPPHVARTDATGVQLGGPMTVKRVKIEWSEVEDVSVENLRLFFDRGNERVLVFPLAYVGKRASELAADVRERLNTANGYSRYDPTGHTPESPEPPEQV